MADTTRLSEPQRRALDRLSAVPLVEGLTPQAWQDLNAFFRREVPRLMQPDREL